MEGFEQSTADWWTEMQFVSAVAGWDDTMSWSSSHWDRLGVCVGWVSAAAVVWWEAVVVTTAGDSGVAVVGLGVTS